MIECQSEDCGHFWSKSRRAQARTQDLSQLVYSRTWTGWDLAYCDVANLTKANVVIGVDGITKELTFHCAWHTFVTTVTLTNGVPIETVSKMLGHKGLKRLSIMRRLLIRRVSEEMKSLKKRYGKLFNVNRAVLFVRIFIWNNSFTVKISRT